MGRLDPRHRNLLRPAHQIRSRRNRPARPPHQQRLDGPHRHHDVPAVWLPALPAGSAEVAAEPVPTRPTNATLPRSDLQSPRSTLSAILSLNKRETTSMAKSVNKVILLGNVGKEPEFKMLPSGQGVANFSIATTETLQRQGRRTPGKDRVAQPRRLCPPRRDRPRLREEGLEALRRGPPHHPLLGRQRKRQEGLPHRDRDRRPVAALRPRRRRRRRQLHPLQQLSLKHRSFDQRGSDDYAHSTEITDDDIPF